MPRTAPDLPCLAALFARVLCPLPRWTGRLPRSISPATLAAFADQVAARHPQLRFSGPAQASLALRPACLLTHLRGPLSPRLRRVGHPSRRSGSYRGASTTPRTGLSPATDTSPFTAHT